MTGRFHLSGARALYATFAELPRTAQRQVLERTLREVITPFGEKVRAKTPVRFGFLRESETVGPYRKLNKRQKRIERQDRGKFEATMHFGTADPAGLMSEFGNAHMSAHPFFRAEWESSKFQMLHDIERTLGPQIIAGAQRIARKNGGRG